MPYGELRTHPAALAALIPVFEHQLLHCRLHAAERAVIVTDETFHPHYAPACARAASHLGAESFQVLLPHGRPWSEDVLRGVFEPADLVVYATTHTLHYASAMREALDAGKRALMVVVPPHVLERRVASPPLMERVKRGAARFERGKAVRIHSRAGTALSMSIAGRRGVASYGVADAPGHLDFWGAGMFQVALVEGSMSGRLVLDTGDQVFHFGRYVDRPVTLTFREGRVVELEGGVEARLIQTHLEAAGEPSAFHAGHIAVGADPEARWTAEAAQFPVAGGGGADAEAFYGNVQVELGSNDDVLFRGRNRSTVHLGLCCLGCTLTVDDETIVSEGKLVPEDLRADGG